MPTERSIFRKIRKGFFPIIMAAVGIFCGIPSGGVHAAGLLIADGGFGGVLEIKEHDVQVTVNNGVAVTQVTQIFQNTEKRQVEALYTFPVPKGASVANFSMWINGREMVGEVIEKKRAREIYDSYKRKRRDPGLLEQVDYKTFEMRVFPINAGAEQKVQITYYQELDIDHDQATYVYPLATVTRTDVDTRTTGKLAINVDIKSAVPITALESPSHGEAFVVVKHSSNYGQASLETTAGSLAADVVINYQLSRPRTGLDLITSRPLDEDGYFCLTLTAGQELAVMDNGLDYVFLLDISGSMGNDSKMILSRNSLEAFIDELGPQDRFEVMTFNVNPNTLFGQLQPANSDMQEVARKYMQSQQAKGGTILAPAMTTAYKYGDPDRTLNVVILSDGMTEQKERQELLQLIQSRPRNARVFCIGVGNEVNRPLLEQMAEESGGLAAFISRGDNFQRQAKAFRRKLLRPVATDLQIQIEGVRVYDIEPKVLPNLYHGAPIRVYGRYAGRGEAQVTLNGNLEGREFSQSEALLFPQRDPNNPEIERMWAWKRIDQLLKKADRTNSRTEVVDEIIRLGEGYSIVTEYTSFLVLENDAEYQRWQIDRRNTRRLNRDRQAQTARQDELEIIRSKAVADIGPQPVIAQDAIPQAPATAPQKIARVPAPQPAVPDPPRSQSRDFNLNFGSGPVGPLFVGMAYWLRRRRRRK
ncbi:MAG: VWA domain-containing protein [Desulfobacterales bacterium]|nr:MAG: VWA domain-containing protein [Desulfobacterales bacterium]